MTNKQFDRMMDALYIKAAYEFSLGLLNASLVGCKRDFKSAEGLASLATFVFRKEELNKPVGASDFMKTDEYYADNAIDHMNNYNTFASVAPDKKRVIEAFVKWNHYDNHSALMMHAHWISSVAIAGNLVVKGDVTEQDFNDWIDRSETIPSVFRLRKKSTAKAFVSMRMKIKEIDSKVCKRQNKAIQNENIESRNINGDTRHCENHNTQSFDRHRQAPGIHQP